MVNEFRRMDRHSADRMEEIVVAEVACPCDSDRYNSKPNDGAHAVPWRHGDVFIFTNDCRRFRSLGASKQVAFWLRLGFELCLSHPFFTFLTDIMSAGNLINPAFRTNLIRHYT